MRLISHLIKSLKQLALPELAPADLSQPVLPEPALPERTLPERTLPALSPKAFPRDVPRAVAERSKAE